MQKSDQLRIDSHKLIFHPHRVVQWLEGQSISPLYIEISPAGSCNHRCTICVTDFMEYRLRYLDTGILLERLSELGSMGVKSIMYAGEGEPLLHPDIARIVKHTQSVGRLWIGQHACPPQSGAVCQVEAYLLGISPRFIHKIGKT